MQSSANSGTVELEMHSGRSFMYTRNRMGPSTVPCGTPEVTGTDVDRGVIKFRKLVAKPGQ